MGDNKVADVRESDRLKESLVCLVNKEDSISFNMAKVLAETGNNMFGMKAERVLEINTSHEVFKAMEKEYEANFYTMKLAYLKICLWKIQNFLLQE